MRTVIEETMLAAKRCLRTGETPEATVLHLQLNPTFAPFAQSVVAMVTGASNYAEWLAS